MEQLECPRCRRPDDPDRRKANGRCTVCHLPLVPSVRDSEAEAWRQLYGGPPRRLRRPDEPEPK